MKHSEVVYIWGLAYIETPAGLVRLGSRGRPEWSGRYGEPTRALRVPVSLIPALLEQMRALEEEEERIKGRLRSDVLFTSEGYSVKDLERVVPSSDPVRARVAAGRKKLPYCIIKRKRSKSV